MPRHYPLSNNGGSVWGYIWFIEDVWEHTNVHNKPLTGEDVILFYTTQFWRLRFKVELILRKDNITVKVSNVCTMRNVREGPLTNVIHFELKKKMKNKLQENDIQEDIIINLFEMTKSRKMFSDVLHARHQKPKKYLQ